ncbi:uncharacterized protein LOC100839113 isoform X2 [Brachypodium distachyon]|uniref:Cathepsin propeptide inhibitor domain-containing protein n=1 Tax=Brachypodium distachyon TaxID=15368 RepID=I1HWJ4_BRADI|nr:uncharacterized protein LOC100839113 isoform X2 [Brachypodium distachyon]KQJ92977.1 hypothetical protein BRADI_3g01980v3 [Brachypodium distachyon]|eukprot:XP_010233731.1 uncharacterized protein LOC100839113 isoform X2 [Brachypodium distachyon]
MSPLRFSGSLVVGRRLSWHRIRAGSAWLKHQSVQRNIADHARGFGSSGSFPKGGKLYASILPVGALSSALVGGMLYLKKDAEVPTTACGLTDEDATRAHELTDEDPTKEAALKARFEEWMIKYERRYKDEEEKALRFREFKRHVKDSEKANTLGSGFCTFEPNGLGDLTEEEGLMRRTGSYDMTARRYIARQRDIVYQRVLEWWYQL